MSATTLSLPRTNILVPYLVIGAVALRLLAYAIAGEAWGGLAAAMCHFDCDWYVRIATEGYGADTEWADFGATPHWAFFPLYPLLLRALSWALPLPVRLEGVLLSSLCLIGFLLVGLAYLRATRGVVRFPLWLGAVLLLPNTHFFAALYTEALFALLATACLLALRRDRPHLAAGLAALASATRPTGIVLTFIIAGTLLPRAWAAPNRSRALADALLPIAFAPLGLSAFMLAQYLELGDALAFSHVQMHWGRHWQGPFAVFINGLAAWDWAALAGPMAQASASYDAAWGLLGLIVAGVLAWRRYFAEAVLLAVCVLLPASTGHDSLPRFVATNPAFLFAAYGLLARLQRLAPALLLGGAALHLIMLYAWMSGAGGVF